MKTRLTHIALLVAVVISLAFVCGCATTSKITQTGGSTLGASGAVVSVVPSSTRVWVLTPKVVFEDTLTGALLDPTAYGGPRVVSALTSKAISALQAKGIPSVACVSDGNLSAEQKSMAEQAGTLANRLVRMDPDPQALRCIQSLAATNDPAAVLVQYVRVKVGPSGTWDPNSGAITSGASSSHFRAALLDCQTGRRLWENSVLLRKLPDPDGSDFGKALPLLYSTLNPQGKP